MRGGGDFSRRVHDDIDGIMEGIQEAHRGRSESAPDMTVTEEEKQWLTRIIQKSELAKSYVPQRGKKKQ